MNYKKLLRLTGSNLSMLVLIATVLLTLSLSAQESSEQGAAGSSQQITPGVSVDAAHKSSDLATSVTTERNEGETGLGFQVKQSAEFGGRISHFTGSEGMWDTLVNLGTGPRLLEYSLDMHSPNHTGVLFDDLTFSNFGYGGDPNDVTRLRMQKGRLYTLTGNFRRDQNIFDYSLFANPLNPAGSNPTVFILHSPHEFLLTRRMNDVNLNLFPLSSVRLRLGWSRVVNEGNTFSSVHEGTEASLLQPTLNTTDNYQFGVSFRFIPRTSLNYDQFYTFFKGDTTAGLDSGAIFGIPQVTLSTGVPVNLGFPFNTPAGQPCATPILSTGFVNPACNGFINYLRTGRSRNSFPTEQITLQSNYFRRVDIAARFNYSDAEASTPDFNELFNGLITRNRVRIFDQAGAALSKRISATADFGITYRLTDRLRLVDNFRFNNFRIPGNWSYVTTNLVGATLTSTPNVFTPATCPPPFTAATCPQHLTASPADVVVDNLSNFLRQDQKVNTFLVEYDFTKRVTAHVGYRYERREITHNDADLQLQTFFPNNAKRGACASGPVDANGVCQAVVTDSDQNNLEINGHSGLVGFSARPTDNLRVSADVEFFSADNAYTRISPRHMQEYKVRSTYRPVDWANLGASIVWHENRNPSFDIGNFQHNRSFAFTSTFAPPDSQWGVDLSYDYQDIFSQTNICFVSTPTPPGALSCGAPFLQGLSFYNSFTNYAAGSLYFKPIPRVTTGVGYTITSTTGNTLILNPNAPAGPLNFNYHLPMATLAVELTKNLVYKTNWNYYGYNEKSDPGPTLPRDVRGNVFTLSLRYSM
jgi:hypothetical protein